MCTIAGQNVVMNEDILMQEQMAIEYVESRKRKRHSNGWGGWPIRKKAVKIFHNVEALQNLRCLSTDKLQHKPVKASGKPKACQLCLGERRTAFECSVCRVRLCTTLKKGEEKSERTHFERWHNCGRLGLLEERDKAVEETKTLIQNERTEREESGKPQLGNFGNEA